MSKENAKQYINDLRGFSEKLRNKLLIPNYREDYTSSLRNIILFLGIYGSSLPLSFSKIEKDQIIKNGLKLNAVFTFLDKSQGSISNVIVKDR